MRLIEGNMDSTIKALMAKGDKYWGPCLGGCGNRMYILAPCPHCGYNIEDEWPTCEVCGDKVPTGMHCGTCEGKRWGKAAGSYIDNIIINAIKKAPG